MNQTTLSIGAEFHGRYRVVRPIKAGGMGAVYEVVDTRSDRHRALKVLLPALVQDQNLRAKFEAEAKITSAIESEHLVEVFDAGVDDTTGVPFIVMELLRGDDLDAVTRRGPLAPAVVLTVLAQVALALEKTHALGIVHRDLKPENLFLTYRDDGSPRARIMDFGIAKVVASASATASRLIGTPLYMAPEQVQATSRVGPSVDLYALGQIAFTLLTGKSYWNEEVTKLDVVPFLVHTSRGATIPASKRAAASGVLLPPAFDAWFARATAVDPRERFATAREMIAALTAAIPRTTGPVPAVESATRSQAIALPTIDRAALVHSQPVEPTPKRRGPVFGALAGALLLGAGLLSWQLAARTPTAPVPASGVATITAPAASASTEPVASGEAPTGEPAPVDVTPLSSASAAPPPPDSGTPPMRAPKPGKTPASKPAAAKPSASPPAKAPAPPKPSTQGEGLL